MKALIISANALPASPSGPAYVAGAALAAGHTVEVFEALFAQDMAGELETQIASFRPDVVGISIRLAHGFVLDEGAEFGTRHLDLRVRVKQIVNCVKRVSDAHIVLGGPGFNYYGPDWLEYLNLNYGLRGEADISFPQYLKELENGGDIHSIPGCVYRTDGRFVKVARKFVDNLDDTAFPAYQLFDLEKYYEIGITPAITTKRGCAFNCTYCPYSSLEGKRYRLKSPQRVVDEIEHIYSIKRPKMVSFCDNNFNVPNQHALAICQEIVDRKLDISWGTGTIKPLKITDDVLRLFKDSGCGYLSLSVESASARMLKQMQRGGTVEHTKQALASLSRSDIPFSVSLLFGAPGETPETIAETLAVMDEFHIPQGVWVTIGICLWTSRQKVLEDARADGQLDDDKALFSSANYISPQLPKEYMAELVKTLSMKENYTVQVNKLYADRER
ncbi:MAG: radical SAM protein [Chloroflexi bacterium]|nr:radical SAM protein [Chloroflexota bacterium]